MEDKDFIVNVGPQGTFKPSGKYSTKPADIDTIFQCLQTNGVRKISIFFHGGLVNEERGMETARKMAKHIADANQAPLCFAWETGLVETVASNIGQISETKLFGKLVKILIKKLSDKLGFDLTEGRGSGQELSDEQIEAELNTEKPFAKYSQDKLQSSGRGSVPADNLPANAEELEPDFRFEIESDLELLAELEQTSLTVQSGRTVQSRGIIDTALLVKHVAMIAFRVIKRFVKKRDHDFYPTIIEELLRELYLAEVGAWVWGNMKKKSADMWKDNNGTSGLTQYAGRYVLDKLIELHKKHNDIEVNLIGHSAGSIAICNLLKTSSAVYPQLIYNKIIFMAPACRMDLFNNEIVTQKQRFKNFRMFTMTDTNEKNDLLVRYFYTHSLLYLISGVLEEEGKEFDAYILGLDRNIKAAFPYDSAPEIVNTNRFLLEENQNRVLFSQTEALPSDGLRTRSLSHGGFDDDPSTIDSIKFILK